MEKSYRIRTNVGEDQVVRTKLQQDIDFLEILSLKIKQEDAYQLHVSNYGMIVGRVLGNNAFGIQNAKVSVFIPITDEDLSNSEIFNLYPYTSLQTLDKENRRYNLLPNTSNDECYRVVGTFPNKRMVLDNNTEIEIFEKYWKYTTVTNKSGDYCIMGVPTGNQEIHVDIDLSDIGILSQKPRDFVYKGYNIEQFDNASQFKESTNLDSLTQLFTQNTSVHVYPFWGEEDVEEVAITRCDIQIQYQFEPTCVFFGSIVSDNYKNSISKRCRPSKNVGSNKNLVAGEGTIEMIRKTTDGLVEEFPIQGNRLIDGNGVWCYQIPMNLDYVGTDEFGNIVPTDNPNKGIATRTSVRFRFSMQETDNEGISRHRAKYLVPNNFDVVANDELKPSISEANLYDRCYEFGSSTPDEHFRDLYWNKVYTVKNYIPRIQKNKSAITNKYSGIKTVNTDGNFNPFPYNHARFNLNFSYRLLCTIMVIIVNIIGVVNGVLATLACWKPFDFDWGQFFEKIKAIKALKEMTPLGFLCGKGDKINCIELGGELFENDDSSSSKEVVYYPNCKRGNGEECKKCQKDIYDLNEYKVETDMDDIEDIIQSNLAKEYDVVNLDFYNDWVNGVLYFPLWFLKQVKKKKYLFGLIERKAKNTYCDCDKSYNRMRLGDICSIEFNSTYNVDNVTDNEKKFNNSKIRSKRLNASHKKKSFIDINRGIIKEFTNKFGKLIYYYSPGNPNSENLRQGEELTDFYRLFSTDIVLLGSLHDCDVDGLPRPYINLPSSTSNIPDVSPSFLEEDDNDEGETVEDSGMDITSNHDSNSTVAKYGRGLLMNLTCNAVTTLHKTCVNLHRLSELGVTLDSHYEEIKPSNNNVNSTYEIFADGMITRYEIVDHETRAMFASLNHNGLRNKVIDGQTTYKKYDLKYVYPSDFDGHMSKYASEYTKTLPKKTIDNVNNEYVKFKFGENANNNTNYMFYNKIGDNLHQFPLFNNSFYFYFGLNEGNTSIDKFNNLFYSSCFQKESFAMSAFIDAKPKNWCGGDDTAVITCELKGVNMPYEYELYYRGIDEAVSKNVNLTDKTLVISSSTIDIKSILEEKNASVIDDAKSFTLENGDYTLKIKDSFGNSLTKQVSIQPYYISINYEKNDLGFLYNEEGEYDDEYITHQDLHGKIIIQSFNLDGKERKISKLTMLSSGLTDDNKEYYEFECESAYTVNLTVEYNVTYKDNSWKEKGVIPFSSFTNSLNELIIKSSIPVDVTLTAQQYCKQISSYTDNVYTDLIHINNGKDFVAFVNNIPFNLFKSHKISGGTEWFGAVTNPESELYDFDILNYQSEVKNNISGYTLTNKKYVSLFNDYIPNITYLDEDKTIFDEETAQNIIKYKFNTLFNFAKNTIFTDSEDLCYINFTSNGGIPPISYRAIRPIIEDDIINCYVDSDTYYVCEQKYVDYYHQGWRKITEYSIANDDEIKPNILFGSDSGRTFSAFASFSKNGNGISLPEEAEYTLNLGVARWKDFKDTKYFKTYFVDNTYSIKGKFSFVDGKLKTDANMIIHSFGGTKMKFNDKYNVIGEGLEYTYDSVDGTIKRNGIEESDKTFYKSSLMINDTDISATISSNTCNDAGISLSAYSNLSDKTINSIEFRHQDCTYDIEISKDENNNIIGTVKPTDELVFKMNNKAYTFDEIKEDVEYKYSCSVEQKDITTGASGSSTKIISDITSYDKSTLKVDTFNEHSFDGNIYITLPHLKVNNGWYNGENNDSVISYKDATSAVCGNIVYKQNYEYSTFEPVRDYLSSYIFADQYVYYLSKNSDIIPYNQLSNYISGIEVPNGVTSYYFVKSYVKTNGEVYNTFILRNTNSTSSGNTNQYRSDATINWKVNSIFLTNQLDLKDVSSNNMLINGAVRLGLSLSGANCTIDSLEFEKNVTSSVGSILKSGTSYNIIYEVFPKGTDVNFNFNLIANGNLIIKINLTYKNNNTNGGTITPIPFNVD